MNGSPILFRNYLKCISRIPKGVIERFGDLTEIEGLGLVRLVYSPGLAWGITETTAT